MSFKKGGLSVKFFLTKERQFCRLMREEEIFHKLNPKVKCPR